MNDILKYWPIRFTYEGEPMMIPMGEIINIRQDSDGKAHIEVKGDCWTSETPYDDVMVQWVGAVAKFGGEK